MPRERQITHPIIDHRDSDEMPEFDREWCARLLKEHEERYHAVHNSEPVKLTGKGFALSGNWRAVVAIVALLSLVAITAILSKYGLPRPTAIPPITGFFSVAAPLTAVGQWTPQTISLGTFIPPVNARYPSAMLHMYFQRRGASDPADTYHGDKTGGGSAAANLGIEFISAHIRRTGFGTVTPYA
jgi:hypothetical protein